MKILLFYERKTKPRHLKIILFAFIFSYLDDAKLFFSTSRYKQLDYYNCK